MTATITPVGPPTLKPHQQQVHDFITTRRFAGAWLDVGGGKTFTTLSALQTVREPGHILVIAPVPIARSTWIDEIEKWNFPLRTASLIVDENDRKLSREARLQRFRDIFTDPPSMYFINQELLTQASHPVRMLAPVVDPPRADVSDGARTVLDLLSTAGMMPRDDLVQHAREHLQQASGASKMPAKKNVASWITELKRAGLIETVEEPCPHCVRTMRDGSRVALGCEHCAFGLIDQMPRQAVRGPDGRMRTTIVWPFPTVVIDESQGFKSHSSRRFQALAEVRPAISRLIELTGTPAANGLHDLWSQIYLLDQGAALGATITEFRNRWFTAKMVPGTNTPAKWIPNPGAEQEIYAAISHLVMSAKNTSLKMPEKLPPQNVNITLPPDLMQRYKEFKRELVLDIIETYRDDDGKLIKDVASIVVENQAVLTSKLMQFASGTMYTADPDDPSTAGRYSIIHDKKIEMVEYLVRNNGGDPVLLAYHFQSDREQLLERLTKAGIDVQVFDGSREMVRRWNEKRIPVMMLHPASAGHGLNLQHGGSTMIWYTLPFSLEHYQQTNGRLHRPGQTTPVTIYQLITKGTQDERMPLVLSGKADVQDALLSAVAAELHDDLDVIDDIGELWLTERI